MPFSWVWNNSVYYNYCVAQMASTDKGSYDDLLQEAEVS